MSECWGGVDEHGVCAGLHRFRVTRHRERNREEHGGVGWGGVRSPSTGDSDKAFVTLPLGIQTKET